MNITFRPLRDEELGLGYAIIVNAVEWLNGKQIRQWTAPLPRVVWQRRQTKGENYALTCDSNIAVVLSLILEVDADWIDELGCGKLWWLSTLTTASTFRGRMLGRLAIREAAVLLKDKAASELCLSCVQGNGFLPACYEAEGFQIMARKDIQYPQQGIFDMVLMKKGL